MNTKLFLALLLTLQMVIGLGVLRASPPIALNPTNPHYFIFRGQPTILIASTEHYGSVINLDFDYITYLNEISSKNLNYTRMFAGSYVEYQGWFGIPQNTLAPATGRFISPWARSSTPGYMNGGNKFDLSQFDPAYFTRLQDFISQANSRGIVVEVSLFCNYYTTQLWQLSPLYEGNNINGINGGGGDGSAAYSLNNGNLGPIQDAYVTKMVTALNGYDNVVYEICNELYNTGTYPWQTHIATLITQTESTLPNKHLIMQNVSNGSEVVPTPDPLVSVFNFHYATPDAPGLNLNLQAVIGADEDGTSGTADIIYRHQSWEFLMSGGGLFDNLDYSFTVAAPTGPVNLNGPSGGDPDLRVQLGILHSFLNSLDFLHMSIDKTTITGGVPSGATTFMMSEAGQQYAVFLEGPNGNNQANLVMNLPAATYVAQWVNTHTGNIDKSETFIHSGGSRTISSPTYLDDIALRITNANGTAGGTGPVITSASTVNGTAGTAFNYQITATNTPTSYNALGLPAGLTVNTTTGLISGTPTNPGTSAATISATNATGTSSELLTFLVSSGGLPSPWLSLDVGSVGASGYAGFSGGTFTVAGSGADIWGTADAFQYVYQTASGDCSITARVKSIQNTDNSAKAAVMIRSDLTAGSAHAMLDVSPGGGIEFIYRTTANGGASRAAISGTAPYWARVTRVGNVFTGYASPDGVTWTQVGSQTIAMGTSVYIGMPVCSHVAGTLGTDTFDNITVTGGSGGGSQPVITSSTAASGTVGTAFTYQITATNAPTSYNATGLPAGLTINTSTGVISGTPSAPGTTNVTISASNNSLTGSANLVLAISGGAGGSLPSPWLNLDIGTVGVAGSATYSTGLFTIKGAGADIWSTADAFQYVYQPVSGDCSITAKVESIQNTNTSAKAAVMIRSDLTAGSAHAMLDVSPGGGIEFIYRTTANAGAGRAAINGTAPSWARVVRAGNLFTGYASSDGTTWTVVGSQTITMGTSVYIGLPACSHVAGTLSTATFDNISVSSGTNPPVITSSTIATAVSGNVFNYQITAPTATSYNATGLPTGLGINTSTGAITGTPTVSGIFPITLTAASSTGTTTVTLVLSLSPGAPSSTDTPTLPPWGLPVMAFLLAIAAGRNLPSALRR